MNWHNKKVLVTGGGGFIGSHLSEALVRSGAKVRAFIHYNALGSHGWLEQSECRSEIEVFPGDVTDPGNVLNAMKDVQIVFHLAALIAIPYSYRAPASYVQTNVLGTLNVLQAARMLNCERVLHTSTSEVYGTAQYVPIDEKHPLQGQSPYAASKIGADKIAESFSLSFDLPIVTVRPFNTFGPRQSMRAIIPTVISQLLAGSKVRLGSLHPTRDLNFVSNTIEGFIQAAETESVIGRTINIGSGVEISIGELVQLIARLMGRNVVIDIEEQRLRPGKSEVERLLADNSLARQALGWTPSISLEEGLRLTIDWIHAHQERYRANEYSI